jgi:hypothetical protein
MIELTILAATLGLIAVGAIWNGYVLTILWGWFIAPTFGLPALSLATAIGLALVVSYLTHQYLPKCAEEGDTWDKLGRAFWHMLMRPAFSLLIGWVVKQWV